MTKKNQPPHDVDHVLTSVSADLMQAPSGTSKAIIYGIGGLVAIGIAWSYFTMVLEVSAATGMVMPKQHVQVVQSLEGGAIEKIFAHAGDHVKTGDLLVSLDSTASSSTRSEVSEQLIALKATSIRLKALLADLAPVYSSEMRDSHPDLVQQSLVQYKASRAELTSSLASFDQQITQRQIEISEIKSKLATGKAAFHLSSEELNSLRKLQKVRAAGRAEVANSEGRNNEIKGQNEQLKLSLKRLEASVADLASQREERLNAFRSRAADGLAETDVKISALSASLKAQQKRFDQTSIRATSTGTLKLIQAVSIGQVVKPGEVVAEIVPDGDALFIQARVRPEDIAFLTVEMPALVKLSAYDYSIFGSLPGTLKRIAADSTTDERGQVYYVVDVQLDKSYIERQNVKWPVKSGMVANVEIVTGQRSIFQYITKPIHRMTNMALKER
jgi:membrane fusion protein, adhesin transport system